MAVDCNCYNCKYKMDVRFTPYKRSDKWCKKQRAWIFCPLRTCLLFKRSFESWLFGDRGPEIRTERLVGGCEEE